MVATHDPHAPVGSQPKVVVERGGQGASVRVELAQRQSPELVDDGRTVVVERERRSCRGCRREAEALLGEKCPDQPIGANWAHRAARGNRGQTAQEILDHTRGSPSGRGKRAERSGPY